jgi:hypothetical protein
MTIEKRPDGTLIRRPADPFTAEALLERAAASRQRWHVEIVEPDGSKRWVMIPAAIGPNDARNQAALDLNPLEHLGDSRPELR